MTRSKFLLRGLFIIFLLAGLLAGILAPTFASVRAAASLMPVNHIVISQVYGGGGNIGATYQNDFVELFNPSSTDIALNAWSIQYASATGTFSKVADLSGTLVVGHYYLVQLGPTSTNGLPLPTPDVIGATSSMSATDGKVVLANTATGLACDGVNVTCNPASIVDLVGYGGATFFEGSVAPPPSNTKSDLRNNNGCLDTDNNSADFLTDTPAPRNTSSAITDCSALITATAIAANLTGTAASNLTGTASVANLTGTAVANLTGTAASNLTATAHSNLTATASAANLTGTAIANLPPTSTSTPCPSAANITYHSLLINEVAWMGTKSSPSDEWVELYNPTACAIDLTNWTLVGSNYYYTSGSFTITFPSGYTIAPGGYFVVANNPGVFQTAWTSNFYPTTTLQLANYYQSLQLRSPAGSQVDTANYAGNTYWPAGSGSPNYATMERYGQADDGPAAWVTYAGPTGPTSTNVKDRIGNYIYGTPGGPNWANTVTITPSPAPTATKRVTPIPPTPFAHVVINEFLPRAGFDWNNDGFIDTNDEFIEIENLGPINVSLSGWRLSDDPNIGGKTFSLPSQTLLPGQRAVYYGSTTHILLVDSGDTIRLTNPYGVIVDARGYGVVKYPDQSHCRIPDGDGYWRTNCFPTPGTENKLTGVIPFTPPIKINQTAPCLLPDTTPAEFRLAVCSPYGADIWNSKYWDDMAGQKQFVIPDPFSKGEVIVK